MWLIDSEALQKITIGYKRGDISAKDQMAFVESRAHEDGSRISTISGKDQEIQISGVLTDKPDFFAMFFGGGNTTYSEIISALATAEADPNIKNITLRFNTPGGNVSGLFKTMQAIASTSKPTTAIVESALSAGFLLASQTNRIIAENVASTIGSNGVAMIMKVDENEIALTNRQSGEKIPDVTTTEGKAVVQDFLDETFNVLAKAIAEGRGVDIATVNKDFGNGRVFLAAEAKKRGMIDSIMTSKSNTKNKMQNGTHSEKKQEETMTAIELKTQHPKTYDDIFEAGIAQEKDRVTAHLIYGAVSSKHMEIATEAISSGSGVTDTIRAKYDTTSKAKLEIDNRNADEGDVGNIKPGAGKDDHDIVADLVAQEMGVTV